MRVAIFDYATGNLHSLAKAFERAGASVSVACDASEALKADALVLPGVGAFGPAAENLGVNAEEIGQALASGFPCLGVCLGMQLLFETSEEGVGSGLGVMRGHVRRLKTQRIPHMGWNHVEVNGDPLFENLAAPTGYYANSFVVEPADADTVIAWSEYERERFPAAVRCKNIWGVQFHPEKSGAQGLQLVRNFLAAVRS
ncbi:MAG: imidazole glycerol phosphate synthase subunit HisH [Gemmatimonadota bacterium]